MNQEEKQIKISWERVEGLADALVRQVQASGFKPDHLVGISMGGLIPLALVAERLSIKSVSTVSASSYDETTKERGELIVSGFSDTAVRGKRVLLVDEIADTGKTLSVVTNILKDQCGARDVRTATLTVNKVHCLTHPDFAALEVNAWVEFPWDSKTT